MAKTQVVEFKVDERRAAHVSGRPNLDIIQAVIQTARTGAAVRVDVPDGMKLDELRAWFSGSPLRYVERRGLAMRTRASAVKNCMWIWAEKARQGYRDALDEITAS